MTEIQTYSGELFDPFNPDMEKIRIVDIAHALSNQPRFAGHTQVFYSVAEHCINVARRVDRKFALAALLHDASEAYLLDIPSPLKRSPVFELYRSYERTLQSMIYINFGVDPIEAPEVKQADIDIGIAEANRYMRPLNLNWLISRMDDPNRGRYRPMSPSVAKEFFLEMFHTYEGGR